jgi:ATP-dependent RNA helicase RhlE
MPVLDGWSFFTNRRMRQNRSAINRDGLSSAGNPCHTARMTDQKSGFESFGISQQILDVLKAKGIATPTPIQHQAIPVGLEGKDIIGIAQTGTGKTFAFGIPLLERLHKHGGRGLIVLPTRELAQQVEESLRPMAMKFNIGLAVFIGGASMHLQRMMIKRNPRILIATPGRLIDHLEQRTITLREVKILVLDEADRMLDMGFAPQINKILRAVPADRQTLLFSATMPHEISKIATTHMKLPVRVEVAPAGTAAELVEQHVIITRKEEKTSLLNSLLKESEGNALIFVRTKHGAKKLAKSLQDLGHKTSEIHSNKSLVQRREALAGFKNGRFRLLVATDIAARGIDVVDLAMVVNYDLPDNPDDYVHRIGRTARAGKAGQAVSFATPDQRGDIRLIEKVIRMKLNVSETPGLPKEAPPQTRHFSPRRSPSRSNFRRRR